MFRALVMIATLAIAPVVMLVSATAQDYMGKTVSITVRVQDGDTVTSNRESIYFGKTSAFLATQGNSAGGRVCGYGRTISQTHRCTRASPAACGGAFGAMSGSANINYEINDSCAMELSPKRACYTASHRQNFTNASVGRGGADVETRVCLEIAGGQCSMTGSTDYVSRNESRADRRFQFRMTSTACVIRNGRRL